MSKAPDSMLWLFYWWLLLPGDVEQGHNLPLEIFKRLRPEWKAGAICGYPGAGYRDRDRAVADYERAKAEADAEREQQGCSGKTCPV